MYNILVMTTAGAALDKCHNAGVNEGFEAWRQFVMEWEPKLRTRYVGLLMNVQGYRFRDDIPTKLAAFERTVHGYENQSTKTVDDDIKIGVTMLGMEDMRVKEHLIRNSVRIKSWNQMREEILEIARTQQYIDSQPMPMQLGANPKGKGKGKGKDSKGSMFQEVLIRVQQMTRRWHHRNCRRRQTIWCTGMRERNHVLVWEMVARFRSDTKRQNVSFSIVSIGEASQQGNWFLFGPGCQAMLPGSSGEFLRSCEGPTCGEVGETARSVLVAMLGNGTHGRSTVVPKSQDSNVSC